MGQLMSGAAEPLISHVLQNITTGRQRVNARYSNDNDNARGVI